MKSPKLGQIRGGSSAGWFGLLLRKFCLFQAINCVEVLVYVF